MTFRNSAIWAVLIFFLIVLFVVDLTKGSADVSLSEIIAVFFPGKGSDPVVSEIILNFRMTKALTCVLAGACLALAGLQMQTLFRNALAGPDVLGLSSGASLAVSLVYMANTAGSVFQPLQQAWSVALAAAIGAFGVFLLMLGVARRVHDNVSLLIVGLMIGAATSSVVSVLQYLSKAEEMQVYVIWTFGSLGGLNWIEIGVLAIILLTGAILAFVNLRAMNIWLLGERYSQSLGVNISKARLSMILSASILTGGVTAFCGPIAFVGLAVPHLIKLLIDTVNHKTLVPGVMLGGAILLLLCDIISQLPGNLILPINAITAMIGAPVVVWIILRHRAVKV